MNISKIELYVGSSERSRKSLKEELSKKTKKTQKKRENKVLTFQAIALHVSKMFS